MVQHTHTWKKVLFIEHPHLRSPATLYGAICVFGRSPVDRALAQEGMRSREREGRVSADM